ncbi:phage tail tape measure protein [Niallia taxi]|uniref:phage tail tape measure protein n=1 Tax=Niallia taxi TaxID=2499688 RepID=UPI0015F3BA2E|nr:phage tail tape measure protein [Niallia taxi]
MADLKIRIVGTINKGATTGEINKALNSIEKKLKQVTVKVNAQIDNKALQAVTKQLSAIQKLTNKGTKSSIISSADVKNSQTVFKSVQEAVKEYSKLGNVKITQTLNPNNTKEVQKFTLAVTNAIGKLQEFNFAQTKNGNYTQTGVKTVNNIQAQNQKLSEQLEIYKRIANMRYNNLKGNQNKIITPEQQVALDRYITAVNNLNSRTPQLSQQMRRLRQDFSEVAAQTQTAQRATASFGEQLQGALFRGAMWSGVYSSIYGVVNAFKDMADQVVLIDEKMTSLYRVMGNTPEYALNEMLQGTIDMSNELSNKVTDVLDIQQQFAQAGYSDEQLTSLTRTAQVLQNISDLSPSDSVSSLLSGIINFNIQATDAMSIADRLNEVDNNFSVTTMDLANSMRKASASAQSYGVDLNNLIGYSTAIASSTRESGNVVGRHKIADIKSLLIDLEPLTYSRGRQGASVKAA